MSTFDTIKDAYADLAIAPLNCTVLFAPFSASPALTLESADDGSLDIPAEYASVGHFEKKAGVSLTNKIDSTDIEAYGEPEPIRQIITKRTTTFDFSMYQNQRNVLELFWSTDFSGVVPSDFGGVVLEAPPQPKNIYYRGILLGLDDRNDREIWPYWLLPKVKLSDIDNQDLNDDGVIMYHPTLTAFKDSSLGYSVAQGFAGPGWRDLVHKAGFVVAPTAIVATPNPVSVTSGGAGSPAQLLVEGDNGINYTPDVTFKSDDTDTATVSSSGEVSAVSSGSTTVTVSYKPVDSTSALTDTVDVTVS